MDKLQKVYEAARALQRSSPLMTGKPMVAVGEEELYALFAALAEIPVQHQQYELREGETIVNWAGLPLTLPVPPTNPIPKGE